MGASNQRVIQAGAVIFDAPKDPGLGWAARASGEPFRIQGVEALASDTLWWVNAEEKAMRWAGLATNIFYRPSNFLRLPMANALVEWGALDEAFDPVDAAGGVAIMAGVFDRLIRLHCAHFGIAHEQWRPPRFSFRGAIREALIPPDQELDKTLLDATNEAYQAYTFCKANFESTPKGYVNFARPRLAHALDVLATPVPATPHYERTDPPDEGESIDEWLDHHPGPMLCRVTLSAMDEDTARLVNFGSGSGNRVIHSERGGDFTSSSMRQWVTGDELRVYAPFAKIDVHEVLFWSDWVRPIEAIGALRDFAAAIEDYDHLSYSLGLYAEQLWVALTTPRPATGLDPHRVKNVIGPFIRAGDRMHCLKSARRVQDQGVTVKGYGVGRVAAMVDADDLAGQTLQVAAISGLIPPLQQATPTAPAASSDGDPIADARLQIAAGGCVADYAAVDEEINRAFAEAIQLPDRVAVKNG